MLILSGMYIVLVQMSDSSSSCSKGIHFSACQDPSSVIFPVTHGTSSFFKSRTRTRKSQLLTWLFDSWMASGPWKSSSRRPRMAPLWESSTKYHRCIVIVLSNENNKGTIAHPFNDFYWQFRGCFPLMISSWQWPTIMKLQIVCTYRKMMSNDNNHNKCHLSPFAIDKHILICKIIFAEFIQQNESITYNTQNTLPCKVESSRSALQYNTDQRDYGISATAKAADCDSRESDLILITIGEYAHNAQYLLLRSEYVDATEWKYNQNTQSTDKNKYRTCTFLM